MVSGAGGLRVLTWNVRNHLGDPIALDRVLRAARADVVCLQEVTRWPFSRYRLRRLAARSGLVFVCGGRASAGTAVLVDPRVDVVAARAAQLPVTGRRVTGWGTRPRGTASAVVRLPGSTLVRVASIHLGLDAAERARHVAAFRRALADGVPTVVAGDLNEPPTGPSWLTLREHLVDACPEGDATYPAAVPRNRIDAVLVDPALGVVPALLDPAAGTGQPGWPDGVDEADVRAASDHLPVMVSLRLPPA